MNIVRTILLSLVTADLFAGASITASSTLLSLEELMKVQVTSTSRRAEDQNLAAGVVTIIDSQEMQQFGARHLRDVLDRIVGTQVLGSHQDYHSKTSMRAFNSSHHEGHVLILLNGRPVRQATDGGLNSDFYLGFPLNVIDHIEVIRGPGSVIYGTNAVAGVINIITKKSDSSVAETQVDIGGGSFSRGQVQLSTLVGNEAYGMNLGVNYIKADGDTIEGVTDEDGNLGDYEWGQESKNAVVNGFYKNLTFNGMIMDNLLGGSNSAFQFPSTEIDLKRYFLDFGYLHQINDDWDVSLNYTFQKDSAVWLINENLPSNNQKNKSHARSDMYETIVRGAIGDDLNLLFGGSYLDVQSKFDFIHPASGLPTLPLSKSTYKSLYTQADYMLSPKQKIIAGVQWNKPDGLSSDFSPRAGFIQGFGENTWLKLLYSQAYRSPTFVETNLDAPQLKGVPTLDPEKVETYDVQLNHQTNNAYYSLALYHSKLDNQIVRVPGSPTTHANEGYVVFNGIEFETHYELNEDTRLIANASYQENETNSGVEQSTFAPEIMVKVGASYSGIKGITLSAFNSYIGKSTDLNVTNIAPAINPSADAYNLLTANIIIDTGKLWGLGKPENSLISVYLDNILNEEIYAPDLNFANKNNTIPSHWGFGAYATYTYKF